MRSACRGSHHSPRRGLGTVSLFDMLSRGLGPVLRFAASRREFRCAKAVLPCWARRPSSAERRSAAASSRCPSDGAGRDAALGVRARPRGLFLTLTAPRSPRRRARARPARPTRGTARRPRARRPSIIRAAGHGRGLGAAASACCARDPRRWSRRSPKRASSSRVARRSRPACAAAVPLALAARVRLRERRRRAVGPRARDAHARDLGL